MRWLIGFTISVLLYVCTFALYRDALKADFVMWDDNVQIVENQSLGELSLARIVWAFTDFETASRYIPLTLLGWVVTYEFCGREPFGYHLGNLLLHCGSVVVAFWTLMAILKISASTQRSAHDAGNERRRNQGWIFACALLGALLWGWHPMRVEVVAWITNRTYCQGVFFLLVSLLLHLQAMQRPTPRQGLYWLSVIAYVMSLLSNGLGLMFPAVLLVLDVFPLRRARIQGRFWRDAALWRCVIGKVPFGIVAAIVLVLTVLARHHQSGVYQSTAASLDDFGIGSRLLQACYLWIYYVWRPWWPFNLTPVRTELVWFEPAHWRFVISAVAVLAITLLLFLVRRRVPAALALWMVHLVALFPMLGWTEHPHYPADRYSTFQGLLWPIAIAGVLYGLRGESRRLGLIQMAAGVLTAAIVLALASLTQRQTRVWLNSETLFRHMLSALAEDDRYRADLHRRLAVYFATLPQPDFIRADIEFQRSIAIVPADERARIMLAEVHMQLERPARAETTLRDGLILNPESNILRLELGRLLLRTGRSAAAIEQIKHVLKRDPHNKAAAQLLQDAQRTSR